MKRRTIRGAKNLGVYILRADLVENLKIVGGAKSPRGGVFFLIASLQNFSVAYLGTLFVIFAMKLRKDSIEIILPFSPHLKNGRPDRECCVSLLLPPPRPPPPFSSAREF